MNVVKTEVATYFRSQAVVWLAMLLLAPTAGCHAWKQEPPLGKSPLRAATPSRDSVTLEIWTVRFPSSESQLSDALWNEIDEQQIPNQVRRRLSHNGLRIGLVGASVPDRLARMLELDDTPPDENAVWQEVDLQAIPNVTRRVVQVRERGEVEIAPTARIHDELRLRVREDGKVREKSYPNAQALLGTQATLNSDGSVTLQFTPQLYYGPSQQKISFQGGAARYDASRAKEVYENLRVRVAISPGGMLLLGSVGDQPESIGHFLFSENSPEGPQQRLLLVRLARSPPGDLFAEE